MQPTGLSGCLYCEGALLAHGQLGLNQGPQPPFCKAAFQPVGLQPVLVWRGYSSPGVEFSQPLDELQRTLFGPFLQPTGVPPNSSTSTGGYQHMNCECDTTDEKEHRGQKTASVFTLSQKQWHRIHKYRQVKLQPPFQRFFFLKTYVSISES